MQTILLVSSDNNYLEMPWIRHILSCFSVVEVSYSNADPFTYSDSIPIFIVSENSTLDKSCYAIHSEKFYYLSRPFGLFHISDEWFIKTDQAILYRHASFVFRNYFSPVFVDSNVFQIPLGVSPDLLSSRSLVPKPFHSRSKLLHYSGKIKYSRISMSRALKKFGFDVFPRFDSYDDYLTHLCDTKYLLCPNGNTTSDTLRLYEALACGCIPITEKTWFTDYIKTLFANKDYPTCPLRSYSTWNHAFNDILRDTLDSSTYQANIQDWWDDLASLLPQLCHNFISSNLISEPFKPSYIFSSG